MYTRLKVTEKYIFVEISSPVASFILKIIKSVLNFQIFTARDNTVVASEEVLALFTIFSSLFILSSTKCVHTHVD